MKPTRKNSSGTSFHGETFRATVTDLREILGEPSFESNSGNDKSNFEWNMETRRGEVFVVYDWKESRVLDEDEIIEWHIASEISRTSSDAINEIASALNELV